MGSRPEGSSPAAESPQGTSWCSVLVTAPYNGQALLHISEVSPQTSNKAVWASVLLPLQALSVSLAHP